MIFILLSLTMAVVIFAGLSVFTKEGHMKLGFRFASGVAFLAIILTFLLNSYVIVPSSHIAVVTTFGKVNDQTLPEGVHFVAPWKTAHPVLIGMDVAAATKSEAGSKDMQSIHADLTVNFHVMPHKVKDLYQLIPTLGYSTAFVVPAVFETFKAVVALYTAEELITKRQEVSERITRSLNERLSQYHLQVQTVNLVNFGFSRAFDSAIEEKVTANQKAQTAENNLKRVKFEAEARITQAEGEAKAIAIQSAAIEKSGGQGYVQLQAIAKWNGALPQYVTSGSPMPFVGVK